MSPRRKDLLPVTEPLVEGLISSKPVTEADRKLFLADTLDADADAIDGKVRKLEAHIRELQAEVNKLTWAATGHRARAAEFRAEVERAEPLPEKP